MDNGVKNEISFVVSLFLSIFAQLKFYMVQAHESIHPTLSIFCYAFVISFSNELYGC